MSAKAAMRFVDSHTEGEPTRVVFDGLPELGEGSVREACARLFAEHPRLRGAIVDEPRGASALVGVLMLPPRSPEHEATLAFINNVGTLPMCVHACVGVARTLAHLGRMPDAAWDRSLRFATPAGEVGVQLEADGVIAVDNVASYRLRAGLELTTSFGTVRGDLAWGGNWFLIVEAPPVLVRAEAIEALTRLCVELRAGLDAAGIHGDDGAAIDHVQLCGPSEIADARNFVLCPGGEHDRSPCGTGTSARMACLFADGRLSPGQRWRQEGITGSVFVGSVAAIEHGVRPTVRGRAWVTAEGRLIFDARDDRAGLGPGRTV